MNADRIAKADAVVDAAYRTISVNPIDIHRATDLQIKEVKDAIQWIIQTNPARWNDVRRFVKRMCDEPDCRRRLIG